MLGGGPPVECGKVNSCRDGKVCLAPHLLGKEKKGSRCS